MSAAAAPLRAALRRRRFLGARAPAPEALTRAPRFLALALRRYGDSALALMDRVAAFLGLRPFAPHEAATFAVQRGVFGGGANSPGSPTSAWDVGVARAPRTFDCDARSEMARW